MKPGLEKGKIFKDEMGYKKRILRKQSNKLVLSGCLASGKMVSGVDSQPGSPKAPHFPGSMLEGGTFLVSVQVLLGLPGSFLLCCLVGRMSPTGGGDTTAEQLHHHVSWHRAASQIRVSLALTRGTELSR